MEQFENKDISILEKHVVYQIMTVLAIVKLFILDLNCKGFIVA